ncbi:MAG: EexN family lipoprotein [Steroidobacteraceae bacterium]|jgi:hypothetical protein
MRHSIKHILASGGLCAAILVVAGCAPRRIPPMTVEDLMEDRVTLDGVLLKCNQDPSKVANPSDCENARIAIERLASQQVDPDVDKKHQAEFEKAREQLRVTQEKLRQEQEAKTKVDPYTLPVVPVDPNASAKGTAPPAQAADPSGPPLAGNATH